MAKRRIGFWRPYQGKGNAAIVDYNEEKSTLWLTFIPEGPEGFDSKRSIVAKLGVQDIGEILAVITGRREGLGVKNEKNYFSGLIHKMRDSQDSSIIYLNPTEKGYSLALGVKRGGAEQATRMSVGLNTGDMENLRVFLEWVLPQMLVAPEQERQQ
jgi:hypothetical protein